MKKHCSKCKKTKEVEHFGKSKTNPTGYQAWCKKCQTENTMRIYREDPRPFRQRHRERVIKCKEYVIEYLQTHPCTDCKIDNILVLEFDHLPQYEKEKNIS